jgi:hypothetical protein
VKNSRVENPVMPATMFVGTVWTELL